MSQVMVSSGGVTSGCGGRRWSRFERARTRDCPTGNSIPYCVVSIWNLSLTRGAQWECDVPVAYGIRRFR